MSDKVAAVIFDFDGLVLDTETPEFESWNRVFRDHKVELELETWAGSIASDGFDPYAHLEWLTGTPVDRNAIRVSRRSYFEELMAAQELLPGVEDYISAANDLGLKTAVASNSTRRWLDDFFGRYGLAGKFDAVSCRDDVEAGKPDPAIYLGALQQLDVPADRAVALEDSPNGVLSANRAGIFCVAVPGNMTKNLLFDHADLKISSLKDVPLSELLAKVI